MFLWCGVRKSSLLLSRRLCLAYFFLLLAGAGIVLFYRLATPSLWLDEAAAPLNAALPVEAIFELSRTLEEHPPFYYLLLKPFLASDHAEWLIRLPSALAGLGCVAMTAAIGRAMFGWPAGLLAASLWLAMPQNVWLSRMARPYAVWQLFSLGSLFFLERFVRRGRPADMAGLLATNVLMTAMHYLSFPLLAAQWLCLAVARPEGGRKAAWLGAGIHAAGVSAIAFAAWFWLVRHSQVPAELAGNGDTLIAAARALTAAVGGVAYYFDGVLPRVAGVTAVLASMAVLARTDRPAWLQLALLMVVPLAVLLALGKATGLYSRHVSFLAAPACLAVAGATVSVPWLASRLPLVLAGVLALALVDPLLVHRQQYYDVKSYQVPVIGNNYKLAAEALAREFRPGTVVSYANPFFGNAVSWYLVRGERPNPVEDQRLGPGDATVRLVCAIGTHFGAMALDASDFRSRYGPGVAVSTVDNASLFAVEIPRDPLRRVTALPALVSLPMDYRGFFSTITAMDGLRFDQNARGPAVIATRNNADATATVRYVNETDGPQDILLNIFYDNAGRDNRLSAQVTFDDEAPVEYPLSTGYDAIHQRQLRLTREKPYKRLDLTFVLRCADLSPTLAGGNLETLRLRGLDAFFCPAGDAACAGQAEQRLAHSLLDNYLEERFAAADGAVRQQADDDRRKGLAEETEPTQKRWSRLRTLSSNTPGQLRLSLRTARDRLMFFPRVGQDSAVRVWAEGPDGNRQLLFGLYNDTPRWTPVSARYEMVVPPWMRGRETAVDIELAGAWAQLWQLGDAVFFER